MPHPKSHTGCAGLFASKLAPTGDLRQASISRLPKSSLWEQSLLAIVVGQVARMLDVSASSRASSLPQGSAAGFDFPATQVFSVGAKLARDSGGSGCKDVGCVGLFASKLAPTEDLRQASISRLPKSSLWEQSLLAIAVGQVARMLDVSASSRASSLPQGICGRLRFPGYPNLLCGSKACSR